MQPLHHNMENKDLVDELTSIYAGCTDPIPPYVRVGNYGQCPKLIYTEEVRGPLKGDVIRVPSRSTPFWGCAHKRSCLTGFFFYTDAPQQGDVKVRGPLKGDVIRVPSRSTPLWGCAHQNTPTHGGVCNYLTIYAVLSCLTLLWRGF